MISPIIRFVYYKAFGNENVSFIDREAINSWFNFHNVYKEVKYTPGELDLFKKWDIQNLIEMLKNEK